MIELKNLNDSHYPLLFEWFNTQAYIDFILSSFRYESYEKMVELMNWRLKYDKWVHPVVIVDTKDRCVGFLYAYKYNKLARHLAVTMYVAKDHRRKGYGVKAFAMYTKMLFEELGLNKIYMEVLQENNASRRIWEKDGFQKEAYYKEHRYVQGELKDVVVFVMYEEDMLRFSRHA